MPDLALIATVTIFIATYAVVALGKVPVYRIDRAGAALLGGSLMLAIGVLTPQEAYRAIDFDTITLLLGMMIVVANLRVSGFFRLVTDWIANANARLTRIGTTYRLPVQPDHTFVLQGFITNSNPEDRTVEVDLWMENDDAERLVIGTATVQFGK